MNTEVNGNIFQDLGNNFAVWFYGDAKPNGKLSKIPFSVTAGKTLNGKVNSSELTSYQAATDYAKAHEQRFAGSSIHLGDGIYNDKGQRLYALDFDNIESNPTAKSWFERLKQETACHTSPSGKGGHALLWGVDEDFKVNCVSLGIEAYTYGQHITVTEDEVGTGSIADGSSILPELLSVIDAKVKPAASVETPSQPDKFSDEEALKKAFSGRGGSYREDLYKGGISKGGDKSDSGLRWQHGLAFAPFCGNAEQLTRIVRGSAHYKSEWDERKDDNHTVLEYDMAKCFSNRKEDRTQEPTQAASNFALTDLGNSERFVQQHKDQVKYVSKWKSWLSWNGKIWEEDSTPKVYQLVKDTVRAIYVEAQQEPDDDKRKAIVRHAMKSESSSSIGGLFSLLSKEADLSIKVEDLNRNNDLLNCLNGVVDLTTGELLPHSPYLDDYQTKMIQAEYIPGSPCPTWNKFLLDVMCGDEELVEYLQLAIGYSLTGVTTEQCLFFLYGLGANGKSTFIELLTSLFGEYSLKTPTETLMTKKKGAVPNDVARLHSARMVTASEVEEGNRLNESLVKDLTGGDTISARFLNKEYFDFKPVFKLWMFGNHKPVIHGTDKGIWRRVRLIPFNATFSEEEKDVKLPQKLEAELSGILSWAVEGCLKWRKQGLHTPAKVLEATTSYQAEMDILGGFIGEYCTIKPGATCRKQDFYEACKKWAERDGEYAQSKRQLSRKMTERGFTSIHTRNGDCWSGIALNASFDDFTEEDAGLF